MKHLILAVLLLAPLPANAQNPSPVLFATHQQFARCLVLSAATHPAYNSFDSGKSAISMAAADCGVQLLAWCEIIPQWSAERCDSEGMIDAQVVLRKMGR